MTKKINIKRFRLLDIWEVFRELSHNKQDKVGAYYIGKNMKKMEEEVILLTEAARPSKEYEVFEKAKEKLQKKMAKKNKDGTPMMEVIGPGRARFIMENREEFEIELTKLKEKHKKAIDAEAKGQEEYEALLQTELELGIYPIQYNWIPNKASPAQMLLLDDFIIGEPSQEEVDKSIGKKEEEPEKESKKKGSTKGKKK